MNGSTRETYVDVIDWIECSLGKTLCTACSSIRLNLDLLLSASRPFSHHFAAEYSLALITGTGTEDWQQAVMPHEKRIEV
jgi:hypothetical protein